MLQLGGPFLFAFVRYDHSFHSGVAFELVHRSFLHRKFDQKHLHSHLNHRHFLFRRFHVSCLHELSIVQTYERSSIFVDTY